VVHDGKRLPRRLSAAVGITDHENGDLGPVAMAQSVHLIHMAVALIGKPPR
jgi:hypothetical protein